MKWLKSGILLAVLLATVNTAPSQEADAEEGELRLPKSSVPMHYDLELTTNVHAGSRSISGIVRINIEIRENTDFITLHNHGLTMDEVKLIASSQAELAIAYTLDEEKEFLIIESLTQPLQVGQLFTIEISYRGLLQLDTIGFYRSSYRVDGGTRYLAATQFESTYARYAFPCYDEPEFKATFTLKIIHGQAYSAIANTIGATVNNADDTATTTFARSPRMSTYLLAFLVSDFDYITNEDELPTPQTIHRVYARRDDVERTRYALDQGALLLRELERYSSTIPYELPKLYSAAIPDFGFGAMENWGLITYKEQYLIGEESSHPRDVLEILKTVAHELGHQFFGNLVTCQWWEYIWLNEGFATYFEYTLVDNVHPNLRMRDHFNIQKLQNTLRVDALETTRAMHTYAETPTAIMSLFDRIAYDKSGSVIRMFQNILGETNFRMALSIYLEDNSYNSVVSDNLYRAFETIISIRSLNLGFSFTNEFKSWENQKGFPIINVSADDETGKITVTQERYYAENEPRVADDDRSWFIPLNMAFAYAPNFNDISFTDYFLSGEEEKIIDYPNNFDGSQWFIFNKQQIGVYRVMYDDSNWQAIIQVLNSPNFNDIHVLNRAQLIDDSLNMAADGYLSYDVALSILNYLKRETDYIPWRAAVLNLDKIDYLLSQTTTHDNFKQSMRHALRRMYKHFGLSETSQDSLMDKFGRELAIDWMCRLGDAQCLEYTFDLFRRSMNNNVVIPDSLEVTVYCNGLRGLDRQTEFVELWRRFQASEDQAKRLRMIDGLLCASDPKVIYNLLETALAGTTETYYRAHERQRIFNNVFVRSPVGVAVTIDFIAEYFDEIAQVTTSTTADSMIVGLSRRLVTSEDEAKLNALLDQLAGNLSEGTREAALRNVNYNRNWRAGGNFEFIGAHYRFQAETLEEQKNQLMLPKTSAPTYYKIHLDTRNIHTGARDFTGEVEIDVVIKENTDYVLLHSKTQVISELRVLTKDRLTEVPILDYELYPATDTLIVYFLNELPAQTEIALLIKYSTLLPTFGSGFYQTSYTRDNQVRYLGVTQFQTTGARYAFPNYDEPEYKAIFELKITHHVSYSAVANTFGNSVLNNDETYTTTFEPTPVMSSYLLAFLVSDFEYLTNEDSIAPGETIHRVWSRPDQTYRVQYAVDQSFAVLKSLEDYVGYKYELNKVDSSAIPNKGGAMENWGMVTYWETAMIYEVDYNDITHALKLSGVDVISHELAHQFFGNTVTCQWWDVSWLNEGFATLFEFHLTDIIHPEWHTRHFFNLRKLQNAFRFDARDATRPMTHQVMTLSEISGVAFNTIAYDKSGSVLRMFQYAVGESIFKTALKLYLETHEHKPVRTEDLIEAFQTTMDAQGFTDFHFETVFRTWELQAGVPLVHVGLTPSGAFNVTQQRFYTLKTDITDTTTTWHIPLTYATASNPNFEDVRPTNYYPDGQATYEFTAPGFNPNQWYVFNKQQLGYYRVNYDAANWNALIAVLNSESYDQIHVLNRVQILDDSLTLAAGGYLDYTTVFRILSYLNHETEYTPWFIADRFLATLHTTFGPMNPDLNALMHHLTRKFYDSFRVPANNVIPVEEVYARYGRELALRLACNAGNEQCLTDTFVQNRRVGVDNLPVPRGLETVTYCSGFRGINKQTEWVAMWHRMQATTDATVKTQMINGLGCSDDPVVLKDYLESIFGAGTSVSYTQAQRRSVFTSVLSSRSGLTAIIRFMKDFELNIISSLAYTLETLLTNIANTIKTRDQQIEFLDYLNTLTHLDSAAYRRVSNVVGNNMAVQQQPQNAEFMAMIQSILAQLGQETTTTAAPPTTAPTTTAPPTTASPTTAPPTTAPPSGNTTTSAPEEATTQGASSIGIKMITLITSVFVANSLKY